MPRLTLQAAHDLGLEEAVRRLNEKFDTVRQAYQAQVSDLQHQWDENTFSFAFAAVGMKVSGTLTIEPSHVRLAAELPLAALMFKGMIEQRIREELGKLLA